MYLNVNWPGGNAVVDFFEEKRVGDNTDRSGSYNDPKVIHRGDVIIALQQYIVHCFLLPLAIISSFAILQNLLILLATSHGKRE